MVSFELLIQFSILIVSIIDLCVVVIDIIKKAN